MNIQLGSYEAKTKLPELPRGYSFRPLAPQGDFGGTSC
jgi:hypothetical protein